MFHLIYMQGLHLLEHVYYALLNLNKTCLFDGVYLRDEIYLRIWIFLHS